MNSQKIRSKEIHTTEGKSIAQIVILPENNKWRIYAAWENERSAVEGWMGFFKSRELVDNITHEAIEETMDYGFDIGHLPESKAIFKAII